MQQPIVWWKSLTASTKKKIYIIVGGTAIIAAIIGLFLFLSVDRSYTTLFTGLNQEETQQIVAVLQDSGVDYRYNRDSGSISVPAASVDSTRASLLSQGYPKSGFSYDMYRNNAGIMSTESDKKQYTLYELQDRLGATIRLFEGVQDARVTIAEAAEARYALGDESVKSASASVTVTMQNGRSLSDASADAIKRLIKTSVKGMDFLEVAVFDAVTMLEVGGSGEAGSTKDQAALASLIENNIAANIRRVLEKLYGQGSTAVSVKGVLNMEKLIQENVLYSTPEKADEFDKVGLLEYEGLANESSMAGSVGGGGVVGADANADVPRYTAQTGAAPVTDAAANSSATRQWLYNTLKEQRQIDPGVLKNTTVAVVIDTDDTSIPIEDLNRLVANASGIELAEADLKVTIVRALSPETVKARALAAQPAPPAQPGTTVLGLPLPIVIAAGAGLVLILLIVILLAVTAKKRKRKAAIAEVSKGALNLQPTEQEQGNEWPEAEFPGFGPAKKRAEQFEEFDELSDNEELIRLSMHKNLRLKQGIGEIVDQNPQIVAKLMHGWIHEGEDGYDGIKNPGK